MIFPRSGVSIAAEGRALGVPDACSMCLHPLDTRCAHCGELACPVCDRCHGCRFVICEACNLAPGPRFWFPGDRWTHPHNWP